MQEVPMSESTMPTTANGTGEVNTVMINTVVIGAGQAGLATGYHLAQRGEEFVILDANARVGDGWRRRWDSLRLFTPARYSGLPGLAHPDPGAYLGKDEVADYLERYAERFALPGQHGVRVTALAKVADGFRLSTSAGESGAAELRARNVVVASGATRVPAVPGFAPGLDADIRQLHSDEYRNSGSVTSGPVLVVGAAPRVPRSRSSWRRRIRSSSPGARPRTSRMPCSGWRVACTGRSSTGCSRARPRSGGRPRGGSTRAGLRSSGSRRSRWRPPAYSGCRASPA
jgi:hypothetical protein